MSNEDKHIEFNDELEELIKKHLKIALDTDAHVITDKPQIIVHLLWDGVVIDSDQITLN